MISTRLGALFVAATLAVSSGANASTYTLDTAYSGADTSGNINISIVDTAANQVTITVTNNLATGEILTELYLNIASYMNVTMSSPKVTGSITLNGFYDSSNAYKADGGGFFDVYFDFAPPGGGTKDTFDVGEVYSVVLTGAGLSAASFNSLSTLGGSTPLGLTASAHVQRIGTADCSGWIATNKEATANNAVTGYDYTTAKNSQGTSCYAPPVPLPASLPIMLTGLAGLGVVGLARRRRRL